MPSGYEKSPDYGGPEPKPWLWGAGLLILVVAVGYWWLSSSLS